MLIKMQVSTEDVINTTGAINEGWLVGDIAITVGLKEGKPLVAK